MGDTPKILLNVPYNRWNQVRINHGLQSDCDIACFLLKHYEDLLSGFQFTVQCGLCKVPLSLCCSNCSPKKCPLKVEPCLAKDSLLPTAIGDEKTFPIDSASHAVCVSESKDVLPTANSKRRKQEKDQQLKQPQRTFPHRLKSKESKQQAHHSLVQEGDQYLGIKNRTITPSLLVPDMSSTEICGDKGRQSEPQNLRPRGKKGQEPQPSQLDQEALDRQLVSMVQHSQCGTLDFKRFMRKYKKSYNGVCPICKKPVKGLKDHLVNHMPQKPFKCQFCMESFNNRNTRTYHILKYHEPGSKRHICDMCGARFYKEYLLKIHHRVHTGDKPYVCEQCGSSFSTSAGLINHRTTHASNAAYTCDQCGKGFHFRCLLKRHMATHSGMPSFSCHLCHKAFFTSKSLKMHEGRHNPIKPHVCHLCGHTFKALYQLSRHAQLHSEERRFHCEFCGKGFKMKSVLATHRRLHTGEKPFHCPECKKAFSDSGNLCKHRHTNHGWSGGARNTSL